MVDVLDLPGSADEDPGDDGDLPAMKERFLASEWADRHAAEGSRSRRDGRRRHRRPRAGSTRSSAAPDGGFTIVDWKTGGRPAGSRPACAGAPARGLPAGVRPAARRRARAGRRGVLLRGHRRDGLARAARRGRAGAAARPPSRTEPPARRPLDQRRAGPGGGRGVPGSAATAAAGGARLGRIPVGSGRTGPSPAARGGRADGGRRVVAGARPTSAWRLAGARVPSEPMYLVMNLAVGGDYPGTPPSNHVFPATFSIDYVRSPSDPASALVNRDRCGGRLLVSRRGSCGACSSGIGCVRSSSSSGLGRVRLIAVAPSRLSSAVVPSTTSSAAGACSPEG